MNEDKHERLAFDGEGTQDSLSDQSSYSQEYEDGGETKYQAATKQLRLLQFANPGRFMDNFDPERSRREMRKLNRRIYCETIRKNQIYDEHGRLLTDSSDLCDCLNNKCPGCHFPCPKCASEKCGAECRSNRRWYYSEIYVEGTHFRLKKELHPPM